MDDDKRTYMDFDNSADFIRWGTARMKQRELEKKAEEKPEWKRRDSRSSVLGPRKAISASCPI